MLLIPRSHAYSFPWVTAWERRWFLKIRSVFVRLNQKEAEWWRFGYIWLFSLCEHWAIKRQRESGMCGGGSTFLELAQPGGKDLVQLVVPALSWIVSASNHWCNKHISPCKLRDVCQTKHKTAIKNKTIPKGITECNKYTLSNCLPVSDQNRLGLQLDQWFWVGSVIWVEMHLFLFLFWLLGLILTMWNKLNWSQRSLSESQT